MRLSLLNEDDKPYRNRVEVFAVKDGKVFGGFYKDGAFGVFGGGTDGEDLESAAEREFEEESGYKVSNLRKADVDSVEVDWQGGPKSDKQKERMKKYRGTRTWYYIGDLGDGSPKDKADGEDGDSGLKDIGLKNIDEVIDNLKEVDVDDPALKKQYAARVKTLEQINNEIGAVTND